MNFVELTSKIANLNALTSDEYAKILTWLLQYRSEAIALEDSRVGSLRSALKECDTKITNLEAALAEARAAVPNVVKVAIGEICRKVVELKERKIDCIKLIRNDKNLVNDGSGDVIALRLAKDIFELVGASEGITCSVASRVNGEHYVNGCTSYYNLKREVEALVKAYYPSYKIEFCDE